MLAPRIANVLAGYQLISSEASVTTTTKKFIQQHPWCCYCGGAAAATTIDHVPAKITFAGKARPQGLEVPSCSSCNKKTKMIDQVGALFARFYPELKGIKDHNDFAKISRALLNNDHDLMREFRKPSVSQIRKCIRMGIPIEAVNSMSMSGPRTDMYLRKRGVKLGLALHYYSTRAIIHLSGGVTAWWYPNVQIMGGDFPTDIAGELGDPATLRQGKWNVGDQFTVRGKWSPNGNLGIYLSTFRNSFAVFSSVQTDRSLLPHRRGIWWHSPGDWSIQAWSWGFRFSYSDPLAVTPLWLLSGVHNS